MWISGLLWGLGEISVLIKDTGHLEFHLSQLKMWEIHSARLAQRLGFYVSFFFFWPRWVLLCSSFLVARSGGHTAQQLDLLASRFNSCDTEA